MKPSPDVVVVGAGVVGTSIAYLLAREGLRVTVLDRGGVGSGSTGHGHGVLSLVGKDFRPGPHFALGRRSAEVFPGFVEQLIEDGGVDPLYHELPGLSLAVTQEEEQIYRGELIRLRDELTLEWIDGERCLDVEPRVTPEAIGAVLHHHGQIDAYRMSVGAVQAVERLGGEMLFARVTGLLRDGDRVCAVVHTGGEIACDTVVLAMGAWAREAEAWIGMPVPVRPLHGEVLTVQLDQDPLRAFILTARHGPILQRRDGTILVGSIGGVTMSGMDVDALHVFDPADPSPGDFDLAPRAANAELMIERALCVMPALEDSELVSHLAGVRPLSADRMPLIGPVPGLDGVLLATGHGTKGIHLAPVTAQIVRDLVMTSENRQPVPADAFRPDRFGEVYSLS